MALHETDLILQQSLPSRIHRPGSVSLRQLGETFIEYFVTIQTNILNFSGCNPVEVCVFMQKRLAEKLNPQNQA